MKTKKLKICFGSILLIIAFSVLFYTQSNDMPVSTKSLGSKKSYQDNKIHSGIMNVTYHYTCGHDEFVVENIPENYIGKTLEEVTATEKHTKILKKTENSLTIEKNINTKCERHFFVRLNGDLLDVYCLKTPEVPVNKIKINIIGLFENELEILKQGIEFPSKDALLEFLEDFGS